MTTRFFRLAAVVACLCFAAPGFAQVPAAHDATVTITVVDPTGGVIPTAMVTVNGLDAATKLQTLKPIMSSDKGVAVFSGLAPGLYTLQAEFPGFDTALVKDVRLKSGDNKHVLILTLKKLSDEVTVTQDKQTAAADRQSAFATAMTREQIDALSDDPDELQKQLQDIAGPDAVFRVDGFEGAPLPPKSQIKAIHITRDQFAAESHYAGGTFIDIITQPGVGPLSGGATMRYQNSKFDGRNAFTPIKGASETQQYYGYVGGTLIKNKLDASLNLNGTTAFSTPILNAETPTGEVVGNANLRTPRTNLGVYANLDYAMTRDQTLKMWYSQSKFDSNNLGVGGFDLPDRAYSRDQNSYYFAAQEAGPLGRRFFMNTELSVGVNNSVANSALNAITIQVPTEFTSGGAQVAGGTKSTNLTLQEDIDYVRGIHSVRMGMLGTANWNRSNDTSNFLGTYTFTSLDAFEAGTPAQFTQRIGNPLVQYSFAQAGFYVQDDIRVRKNLTLSPGVRYEVQTHLQDYNNIAPRFGATWSPFKSGATTLRASAGIFYDWLSAGNYEQTLRLNGVQQQEVNITDPTFPDPNLDAATGVSTPSDKYLLGPDLAMVRTVRFSGGFSQRLTKRITLGETYAHTDQHNILRGDNLNAPVDGLRPDPAFQNVIEALSDASAIANSLTSSLSINIAAPSPDLQKARFNWRRGSVFVFYTLAKSDGDAIGAFSVSPTGTLATEWGPSNGDVRHRITGSFSSSALKNLNAQISLSASSGVPYTITTGTDDNGDFIFNDRPDGVGRNTLRGPDQWTLNGYFSYYFTFGTRATAGPGGIMISSVNGVLAASSAAPNTSRYRMSINLSVNNLTNHANLAGFNANLSAPLLFGRATQAVGQRSMNLSMSFSW